jgi:hypothetical protein
LPRLGLSCNPPDLLLPSSWDYTHIPLCPDFSSGFNAEYLQIFGKTVLWLHVEKEARHPESCFQVVVMTVIMVLWISLFY